jgi:hypothetical protein
MTVMSLNDLKEMLKKFPPYALAPAIRIDTNKVNVGLIREGLRKEANKKSNYFPIAFDYETGFFKVNEKQLW